MDKTTYCSYWQEEFKWISKCKSDQYSAFSKACNKRFRISGSGMGQAKSHHLSKKHLERLDKLQCGKQRTFTSGENGQMVLTKLKGSLTEKKKDIECKNLTSTTYCPVQQIFFKYHRSCSFVSANVSRFINCS